MKVLVGCGGARKCVWWLSCGHGGSEVGMVARKCAWWLGGAHSGSQLVGRGGGCLFDHPRVVGRLCAARNWYW